MFSHRFYSRFQFTILLFPCFGASRQIYKLRQNESIILGSHYVRFYSADLFLFHESIKHAFRMILQRAAMYGSFRRRTRQSQRTQQATEGL